jgi:hypothetical protein
MKRFRDTGLILLLLAASAPGAVIDRIAALVDRQVITLSEISQMAEIRFFPPEAGQSDNDYRHNILESLIAQALRYRDVQRFEAEDIGKDAIEARLQQIEGRFASPAEFAAAVQRAELTLDEVRALIKRQLQVESYIQERFAPMIFVSSDEIETYYRGPWSQERRARGLTIPPLATVQDDIRTLLKATRQQRDVERWTAQLRSQANVDIYTWR